MKEHIQAASDKALFSYRVELSMTCPRCDRPIPVDGPVSSAHCMYCQHDLTIEKEYWTSHLKEACKDMQETPPGQGSGSMMFGTNTGNLTLGRLNPYCDNCKTEFENPWALEPGTMYKCRECDSSWAVQSPPGWLSEAVPEIVQLINAILETDEENPVSKSTLTSVSCPSCAGSLSIDGTSRLVRCSYCDKQIYLPDDLWKRLHGVRVKRRWFVICEYSN